MFEFLDDLKFVWSLYYEWFYMVNGVFFVMLYLELFLIVILREVIEDVDDEVVCEEVKGFIV